jgi:hypothetical protein
MYRRSRGKKMGASRIPYTIDVCPGCQERHQLTLRIETSAPSSAESAGSVPVAIFGGTGETDARPVIQQWDLAFLCPKLQRPFSTEVEIPLSDGYELLSVSQDSSLAANDEWPSGELTEWVKASAANGRDFSKTMISSLIVAFPVYFAVSQYLGVKHASHGLQSLGVIPPLLLLSSIATFIAAMRPVREIVSSVDDFVRYRDRRLKEMDDRIRIGLVLLWFALLCAVVFWCILIGTR